MNQSKFSGWISMKNFARIYFRESRKKKQIFYEYFKLSRVNILKKNMARIKSYVLHPMFIYEASKW